MVYTEKNPKKVKRYYDPEESNFTGVVISESDNIAHYKDGEIHRIDGPALYPKEDQPLHKQLEEYPYGAKCWFYEGQQYGFNNDFTKASWMNKFRFEIFK